MDTSRSSRTRNMFSLMTTVYRKCRPLSVMCALLSVWMCWFVISYTGQYNNWMSRFQVFVTNASETGRYPPAHVSRVVTNSSAMLSMVVKDRHTNVTDVKTINVDQHPEATESPVPNNCTFPYIDPLDPAIMALAKVYPPIDCKQGIPNVVYLDKYTIKVNHSKLAFFQNKNKTFKECVYKSVDRKRGSDFQTVVLNVSAGFKDSATLRDGDNNVIVECFDNNKSVITRSYFAVIRPRKDLEQLLQDNLKKHISKNAPKEVFSVLFIGIDGNSKQNIQRMMPKTRKFLLNDLKAIELHKYNTVGGNTVDAVIPLLTGRHTSELLKGNWTTKKHFDMINDLFLWHDFRNAGYRTGMFSDHTHITAFHYLKAGWNKSPVDYYLRATLLQMERDKLMRSQSGRCVGDVAEITLNHDFWIQMASTFNNSRSQPYFGYSFSADLTHDDLNQASAGDDLYLAFLRQMRDKNIINNTVIIFFSDHGERFGKIRATYNGFIESRTPYIFLIFPAWFHKKYPDVIKVLKINQERLTSNFDLHETARDLLNFQATTGHGDITKRGISLFKEIPPERTCKDAGIPVNYCVCTAMIPANISESFYQTLASAVLKKVASILDNFRDKCSQLSVKSVRNVLAVKKGDETLKKSGKDKQFYQMTLVTTPGGAVLEAKLSYQPSNKLIQVIGDVTRLNMYRGQAECVQDSYLRQFCFCKK